VTRHGFALNVVNDLLPFAAIVPCGLAGAGMTSVALAKGAALEFEAMGRAVVGAFQEVFRLALQKERVAEWPASGGARLASLECVSSKGA
jgi:lipoate-protein ligase B